MNVASQKTLQQKEWATIDSAEWENIDWITVEARVNKLQSQITKAVIRGRKNLVKKLQYLLSKSYSAKLLSIKKVTTRPRLNHINNIDKYLRIFHLDKAFLILDLQVL